MSFRFLHPKDERVSAGPIHKPGRNGTRHRDSGCCASGTQPNQQFTVQARPSTQHSSHVAKDNQTLSDNGCLAPTGLELLHTTAGHLSGSCHHRLRLNLIPPSEILNLTSSHLQGNAHLLPRIFDHNKSPYHAPSSFRPKDSDHALLLVPSLCIIICELGLHKM